MQCRGTCKELKAPSVRRNEQRYRPGVKRCSHCKIYIKCDDLLCPCCKSHLRTKPRFGASRQRYEVKRN